MRVDAGPRPVRVVPIAHDDTVLVRREALGTGTAGDLTRFAEDDVEATRHLGAQIEVADTIVAVVSFTPQAAPWNPGPRATRFFALGVSPRWQRNGIGRRLVGEMEWHAREGGAQLLWANARDSALSFYRGIGFAVVGEGFVSALTGIPSHRVVKRLLPVS